MSHGHPKKPQPSDRYKLGSGVRRRLSSASIPRVVPGTVLIVDDDASLRAGLERMVAAGGWDAISTDDPQLALALCIKERPDVVISDYDMPHLKGDKLALLLEVALGDEAPPVIIVTASQPASLRGDAGVARVLQKPIAEAPLHAAIETLIAKASAMR